MTDESESIDQQSSSIDDDPRFEVKWRKKESSSPPPRSEPEQSASTDGADDIAELRRQLAAAEQRATDLQDRWHRAAADLSNLRKRTEQDKSEVEKFASMMLVADLLPVLDNFERALATIPGNLAMLTWIQGVMLIERHMRAILEHQGLAPIEAEGQPFNPHLHEAIGERETDSVPPGHVAQVYQKGYTMHGRVIRPSLVELAKSAPPASSDGEPAPDTDESSPIAEEATTENTGP
jgi:molecular chaperone GrpE